MATRSIKIELDTYYIKNYLQAEVVQCFRQKLNEYFSELMVELAKKNDVVIEQLLLQNKRVLDMFSNGGNLSNVTFEFIDFEFTQMDHIEDVAIRYYVSKGLYACRLSLFGITDLNSDLKKIILPFIDDNKKAEIGAPDLIVVNKNGNGHFFLVEVKSEKDSLKRDQILWFRNHPNIPIKVLFITKKEAQI